MSLLSLMKIAHPFDDVLDQCLDLERGIVKVLLILKVMNE